MIRFEQHVQIRVNLSWKALNEVIQLLVQDDAVAPNGPADA